MSRRGRRASDDDSDYDNAEDEDDEFKPALPFGGQQGQGRVGGKRSRPGAVEEEGERMRDCSDLRLKRDHESRPLWVTRDHLILLEAFSPIYQQTYDFLVAISEPEARPEFIHRYRLTQNSLYAAVAIAIDTETIIRVLGTLCKTDLPAETVAFIRDCTRTFGKAKLVLKDNKYRVESLYPEVLQELLKHEAIKTARVYAQDVTAFDESVAPLEDSDNLGYRAILEAEDEADQEVGGALLQREARKLVSFNIAQEHVQTVKRHALDGYAPYIARYPLIEEYDFRNDAFNPVLGIDLRPSTRIRVILALSFPRW